MKAQYILSSLFALFAPFTHAAELNFCPAEWNKININGHSTLEVWGVPGLGSRPLVANPDYDWPTEAAVFAWWKSIRDARANGECITIYYNPTASSEGFDIWGISE
jgi:hypothetical protein